ALPPEAGAALEDRTEGWAVGLQLAALSLQGRPDTEEFLDAFTGTHRYVLDYQRRGPRTTTGPGAEVLAPDLNPGAAQRPALRRRDRGLGRPGHAGGAGAGQPVPAPPRRATPLVAPASPVRC